MGIWAWEIVHFGPVVVINSDDWFTFYPGRLPHHLGPVLQSRSRTSVVVGDDVGTEGYRGCVLYSLD